jgi:uncharacterized membrane protein YdbT with pleckstrin-like domain
MNHSTLGAEETVLWSGSVSHWRFAGRWCIALLLLAALVASFVWPGTEHLFPVDGERAIGLTDGGIWIVRGALAILTLAILLWIWIARARRKYTVTNKRVSVEYGIISKNSNEIRIEHIRSINLSTKGLSGLFGIGQVEFSSAAADDAEVIFHYVPGAERLRDKVRSLQTVESGG